MTSHTATWALPYQDGTDRGCDYGPVWCELVGIVESVLATAEDAETLGRNVPMAKIYNNDLVQPGFCATVQVRSIGIAMAGVAVDTDGMVDLALTPNAITPTRPGIYLSTAYTEHFESAGGVVMTGFVGAINVTFFQLVDSDVAVFVGLPADTTGVTHNDPQLSISTQFNWFPPSEGIGVMMDASVDRRCCLAEIICWRIGDAP